MFALDEKEGKFSYLCTISLNSPIYLIEWLKITDIKLVYGQNYSPTLIMRIIPILL